MADQTLPPVGRGQWASVAGESTAGGSPRRLGGDRPESPGRVLLTSKLKPGLMGGHRLHPRLRGLLTPRPGSLVLVHAAAGYGKTTALAATREPGCLWYNLDRGERVPAVLAARLAGALGVEPLPEDADSAGEVVAAALAQRLASQRVGITLDRYEQLGDAPEVGRLLNALLELLPALSLRIATRTRPPLPLERLRLEGRLVQVGQPELRLPRERLAELLAEALRRPVRPDELDFADSVLGGWPAAVRLWLAGLDEGETDLAAPLAPGRPLHDYLHEELLRGTLTPDQMETFRTEVGWLPGPGPVLDRAPTTEQRLAVADVMIRHRVGVVLAPGGWHWHPLVARFLDMHRGDEHQAAAAERTVAIRAFGELTVMVDQVPVDDAAWPTASRRLLELLLSLPGYQATARQAAQLLWPAHRPRSALNSFNVALHGLRRILEPHLTSGAESRYVVRQGPVYRLRLDDVTCDVEDFSRLARQVPGPLRDEAAHHLEAAIALYRGDFLASSAESFVLERRARLRGIMLDTLERLGEWHAATGRGARALRAFSRILELAPHREHVWARVLELHLAAGDEYLALAALHQCEQSLDAARIEPSDFLVELRRRIRKEGRGREAEPR